MNKNSRNKISIIRLINILKKERLIILFASLSSIINKILDLAPPILIGIAVDIIVREKDSWIASIGIKEVPDQLIFISIISCLIWTAESFFEYLYGLLWRNIAQIAQHKLRIRAYSHLQDLDIAFFESDNTGRLMAILNDDINQLERFLDHGANQIIQLFITIFIIGGTMLKIAPEIALISFLPIPIILFGSINFQKKLTPRYKEVRKRSGDLASRLNNNIGGILTIKSFATELWELKKLESDSISYQKSNNKAIELSAAFVPLIRFAILFAFISILYIGGIKAWNNEITVGTYSFLVFITQRLLWPLTLLGQILDEYQRSMASTNRVLDLIDTPISILGGNSILNKKEVKGKILFKDVSFNYKDRNQTLNNINLLIEPNSTIGIVGPTGSGKSTIIKLLLRLYEPSKGHIFIDDISINNLKLQDLRRSISLVSQDTYLFQGSIIENISYGSAIKNTLIDKDLIIDAAKLSEAHEFIINLPNGYETIIGERGQKLSGGQKQRIAIARAILKDAPILILDEATASVDNETEAIIQRSLQKIIKNRTTLIVAHRLSTIKNAQKIIVIEKGKIAETGTHDELIKNNFLYKNLWNVQTGNQ